MELEILSSSILFDCLSFTFFSASHHPDKLQIQVLNQCQDLGVVFRRERLLHFKKDGVRARNFARRRVGSGWQCVSRFRLHQGDEPVGDVYVRFAFLLGGSLLEIVRHGDMQVWTLGSLIHPDIIAIDIGEGENLAALEYLNSVIELTFAASGEPDAFRTECGTDDGGLL